MPPNPLQILIEELRIEEKTISQQIGHQVVERDTIVSVRDRIEATMARMKLVQMPALPFPVRPRVAMQSDENYVLNNLGTAMFLLDYHSPSKTGEGK